MLKRILQARSILSKQLEMWKLQRLYSYLQAKSPEPRVLCPLQRSASASRSRRGLLQKQVRRNSRRCYLARLERRLLSCDPLMPSARGNHHGR
jgi:hypothetical protein